MIIGHEPITRALFARCLLRNGDGDEHGIGDHDGHSTELASPHSGHVRHAELGECFAEC